MIWSLALTSSAAASSSSDSAELAYSLLKTYQNGHDGKSMWSVCSAVIDKQVVVLTGGADGGVRSWLAPRGQEQAREGGAAPDKNGCELS